LVVFFFSHFSPIAWPEIEGRDFVYAARYVSVCIFPKLLFRPWDVVVMIYQVTSL